MADQDEVEDGSLILVDDLDDSDIQVWLFDAYFYECIGDVIP